MFADNIRTVFEANNRITNILEKNNSHWSLKQIKNIIGSILYEKYIILYGNRKRCESTEEFKIMDSMLKSISSFLSEVKLAENINQINEYHAKYRDEHLRSIGEISVIRPNTSILMCRNHRYFGYSYGQDEANNLNNYSFVDKISTGNRDKVNLYIGASPVITHPNHYFGTIRRILDKWGNNNKPNIATYFHIDSNYLPYEIPDFLKENHMIAKDKDVKIYPRFDISLSISINEDGLSESVAVNYKHTRQNGIGIFLVPWENISNKAIVSVLAYWTNLNVYKISEDFIALVGIKKNSKNIVESTNNRGYYDFIEKIVDVISNNTVCEDIYAVESTPLEIVFRGFNVTREDVDKFINSNESNIKKNAKTINDKLCNNDILGYKNPIMPFSPGQLGLALVSGYIDGVVEDGDAPHVIKGTVEKNTAYSTEQVEEYITHSHATTRNATSIIMLTGDGTIKRLI